MHFNVGWPEGIYLGLLFLSLLIAAGNDGKPKTGEHNFGISLIASAIFFGLLYWG